MVIIRPPLHMASCFSSCLDSLTISSHDFTFDRYTQEINNLYLKYVALQGSVYIILGLIIVLEEFRFIPLAGPNYQFLTKHNICK